MQTRHDSTPNSRGMVLAIASTLLLLTACGTPTPTSSQPNSMAAPVIAPAREVSPGFCDNAKPIHWVASMPDVILREVKAHNAVGHRLCGWPL